MIVEEHHQRRMSEINKKGVKIVTRRANTITAAPVIEMPNIHDFWRWTEDKKKSRGMSYQDMVDAGKRVGVTIDRSTIKQAIKFNRKPSTEMLALIAEAFDVPIAEVYKAAGIFTEIPQDIIDSRPLLLKVLTNGQRMTDDELEIIIAQQEAVLAQKRRQLRNGGKSRR